MGDRGAERAVLGAFRVDVDPLVVPGGVGELVDLVLGDFAVLGDPEVGAGEGEQFVEIDDEIGHGVLLEGWAGYGNVRRRRRERGVMVQWGAGVSG